MTTKKAFIFFAHFVATAIVWWVAAFIVFILSFNYRFNSQLDSFATLAGLPTIASIGYLYFAFRLLPHLLARLRKSTNESNE